MTSTSYRVELATTARAGCNNMECKDAGIKIQKNELRLGTWVEIRDYGGWQWKHWGCVTGKQLENMRNYLEDGKGGYMWDKLDGYNDGGKGSLDDHPEMQEKVRRVVTQGFIDPEDWKGDPEMNTLGKSGTRTVESKKKFKEQKSADMGSLTEIQAKWDEALREKELLVKDGKENGMKLKALNKKIEEFSKEMDRRRKEEEKQKAYRESSAVKAESANTPKKRSRVKKEDIDEEEQEDEKPVRKKRGGKVKKEEDSEEEVMPVKRARGKKIAVKKEEDEKPVKKKRGGKVKKEEDSEEEVLPIKKARGKRVAVEKEEEDDDDEEEEAAKPVPVKESRAKKPVIKKGVKEEDDDEDEILTKSAPAAKKGRKNSKKVKEEPKSETPDLVSDDDTSKNQKAEPLDEEMKDEEDEEEVKPVKKTRGRPAKKTRA
ncbi:hypothetical protein SS1G_11605 [Sclerotinia sclerotiorum 1980 UF-70]|uniref:PARP-type domain-containing protein n=2 Tax=Sclerotinia sclerotiorum (strain ATCC 18683 / 1980 / Ss-1) TaxID=665079 RepID=A7F1Y4_SCLS1|nr:hypothetical protein SS1G_11605 [Sclerotinia sclerotiorum 1980 UF-70]APA11355.1 hypothetical protein sscle_07g061250 [Sclerotinia sclerotiorum 1980 UF-70]EDN95726.1 hypothetical protein SS1G_11605 [Sclerotinia sclerotiorum 1980 UF-70]